MVAALVDFRYAYDALGNVVVEGEHAYGMTGCLGWSRLTGRASRMTRSAIVFGSTWRTAQHSAPTMTPPINWSELDGALLEYDARGNLVAEAGQRFDWDVAGRLRGVTLADGTRTSYDYDAAGNLYVERRGASRRQFALDLGAPLPQVLSIVGDGEPVEFAYGPHTHCPGRE